jgi:hypothetical protein
MAHRPLGVAALLLCGCTVSNPLFNGGLGVDGGQHDIGQPQPGHDLAPGPDLAAQCQPGERACSTTATAASARCEGGKFAADRLCPSQSVCMTGYCQPPPQNPGGGAGDPCDGNGGPRENDCTFFSQLLSCQPFVDPASKMVSWVCDNEVGMGLPGATCTKGGQCRTGFCGSNGTCYRGCLSAQDCPINGGVVLQCAPVSITVEGVSVTANSCIPM